MTTGERDYVLGTHDPELERLGLQHAVWRPRALDAWRRAGFTVGQTLLDIGCGPGYASLDLADVTGPTGHVVAIDRSRRFLDALNSTAHRRGVNHIRVDEQDLDELNLHDAQADGAWCRWVLCFLHKPRHVLEQVYAALKPGGVFVMHEYFDYATWRMAPRVEELEEFVQIVMRSWRQSGGEPDIALDLPAWLRDAGFEVRSTMPIVDVVPPSNFAWQWLARFVEVGLERQVELGQLSSDRAAHIARAFASAEASAGTLMVTPAVMEIIAVK